MYLGTDPPPTVVTVWVSSATSLGCATSTPSGTAACTLATSVDASLEHRMYERGYKLRLSYVPAYIRRIEPEQPWCDPRPNGTQAVTELDRVRRCIAYRCTRYNYESATPNQLRACFVMCVISLSLNTICLVQPDGIPWDASYCPACHDSVFRQPRRAGSTLPLPHLHASRSRPDDEFSPGFDERCTTITSEDI